MRSLEYFIVSALWQTSECVALTFHGLTTIIDMAPVSCCTEAIRMIGCESLKILGQKIQITTHQAPTASIAGKYPSLRLLSSLLISSIEVAFAIACLTLSASSFDINRPALPASGTGLGSSIVMATFVLCFETVEDIVVASAVGRPSAVRNSDLPVCRSYMVWKRSSCIEDGCENDFWRTLSRIL